MVQYFKYFDPRLAGSKAEMSLWKGVAEQRYLVPGSCNTEQVNSAREKGARNRLQDSPRHTQDYVLLIPRQLPSQPS